MPIKLYGLKNCDTCKKALKALEASGRQVDFIDIRAEADLRNKVPAWLAALGAEKLINKRSTTWRNLNNSERESAPEVLLITNPTLIKRPVIESNGATLVGWTKDVEAVVT